MAEGEQQDFNLKLIDQMSAPAKQISDQLTNMNNTLFESLKAIQALHKKQKDPAPKTFGTRFHELVTTMHDGLEIVRDWGGELVNLGREFINASAEEEAFAKRLELLTGSADAAEELGRALDAVRPFFSGTEKEMKAIAEHALQLGFEADELKNVLPLAFDVKAITGSAEKADEFLKIYNKIAVTGGLNAKQMDKFKSSGLGAFGKFLVAGQSAEQQMLAIGKAVTEKKGGIAGAASIEAAKSLDNLLIRLGELPGKMFEAFKATPGFDKLKNTIANLLVTVGPGTPTFARLSSTMSKLVSIGIEAMTAAVITLSGVIGPLIEFFDTFWPSIKTGIVVIGEAVIAQKLWNETMKLTGQDGAAVLKMSMGDLFGAMKSGATGALPLLQSGIKNLWTTLKANPIGIIVAGFEAWMSVFREIRKEWEFLKMEFPALKKLSELFGKNSGDAMAEPIKAKLKSTGIEGAQALNEGFAGEEKIRSPSKVFEKFGEQISAGFAIGASDMAAPAPLPPIASLGNNTRVGGVTINLNVDGAGGSPQAIATKLAELIPGALASVFENLALQEGAA